MKELLWKYLAGPIVADARGVETAVWNGITATPGYNPVNTFFYAATALLLLSGAYKVIESKDIEFDPSTAVHSIPFILLGGTLRFLEDASAVPYPYNIVLITPFIYILIASIYLPSLYCLEERRLSYLGILLLTPSLLLAFLQVETVQYLYIGAVMLLSILSTLIYRGAVKQDYSSMPLTFLVFTQVFEGFASTLSLLKIFGNYTPKQLLAELFTSVFGLPGVLLMKLGVLGLALSIITDIEDERTETAVLLVLYSIGLGTGFRVFLRVMAGI